MTPTGRFHQITLLRGLDREYASRSLQDQYRFPIFSLGKLENMGEPFLVQGVDPLGLLRGAGMKKPPIGGFFIPAPYRGRIQNSLVEQFRALNWMNIKSRLEFSAILELFPKNPAILA